MTTHDPISTPFTAVSIADEVLQGVHLAGVRAIVTGASSGIGIETARALTAAVTLAVRNTTVGDSVAETIEKSTGAIRPRVLRLDLADMDAVTRFVEAWDGPFHLLVNNAGLVTGGLERTQEGWELQFATNHLGHSPSPPAYTPPWPEGRPNSTEHGSPAPAWPCRHRSLSRGPGGTWQGGACLSQPGPDMAPAFFVGMPSKRC